MTRIRRWFAKRMMKRLTKRYGAALDDSEFGIALVNAALSAIQEQASSDQKQSPTWRTWVSYTSPGEVPERRIDELTMKHPTIEQAISKAHAIGDTRGFDANVVKTERLVPPWDQDVWHNSKACNE